MTAIPEQATVAGTKAAWLALAAYALVTAVFLWPMPRDPGTLTIRNPDLYGSAWTLAFVVRQAFRDPLHLFDANTFYPHPLSLCFLESLLPQSIQAAPILLAGGGPLLAHNILVLVSFPLAGLGAFLLARELGASRGGAFLGGLGYAFCAYRFHHLVHLQSLSIQWLPLAVLFVRRAALDGRRRNYVLAAVFAVLQATSSGYYAVPLALALGVVLAWHGRVSFRRGTFIPLLVALAVAAAVSGLAFVPHRLALKRQEALRGRPMTRSLEEVRQWSARWSSYANPGQHVALPHQKALRAATGGSEPLYPTLVIGVLALVALVTRPRAETVRLAALLTLAGVLLSLGPLISLGTISIPGPFEAIRRLPAVSMMRTPSRFGVLGLLGLSLLAAIGWTHISRGLRFASWFAGAAAALVLVEAYPAGIGSAIRPMPPPPPTVRWLAEAPRGPVLELPWDHETFGNAATYALWSTGHWQPMVNGWASFEPVGCFELGVLGKLFPSAYSARILRQAGVRYVVLHLDEMPPARRARIVGTAELAEGVSLAVDFGAHRIYAIAPPPAVPSGGRSN